MCVICLKPAGVSISKRVLEACFNTNPDYAGFAYAENGKVTIDKGYGKFDEFYNALPRDFTKRQMLLHFRISTGGLIRPENAHPFPISNKYEDLLKTKMQTSVALVHNGHVRLTGISPEEQKIYQDTMIYIKRIVYNEMLKGKLEQELQESVDPKYGNNKFAILRGDGSFKLFGNFIEQDGCMFSNLNWKWDTETKSKKLVKRNGVWQSTSKGMVAASSLPLSTGYNKLHTTEVLCPRCKAVNLYKHELAQGMCDDCVTAPFYNDGKYPTWGD